MPYILDASSFGLADDIPLGGWFASVPFSFSAADGGRPQASWDHLLLVAHLATERENSDGFRTVSSSALAAGGRLSVKTAGGDETLKAEEIRLSQVCSQQSVGESETLWIYRGMGFNAVSNKATGLAWTPPPQPFVDWGKADANRFGWKGEVDEVGKLSYARVDWSGSQYFRAVDLAGPAGEKGARALANTILGCFELDGSTSPGTPPGPRLGTICSLLTVKDGSRSDRNLDLFSNTPGGISQVLGAQGAVWFAHGSFVDMRPEALNSLARRSHTRNLDLSNLLGDMPLSKTMLLNLDNDSAVKRCRNSDIVFEGVSLWNLSQRQNAGGAKISDDPVLL